MKLPPRHGLTLLELLIALALTGAMAVSLAQWVSIAANTSVRCDGRADSVGPVLAFFQLIQDDLDAITFPPSQGLEKSNRGKPPNAQVERVRLDDGGTTLSITTRISAHQLPASMTGPIDAIVCYRWDRSSLEITRQFLTFGGEKIQDTDRCVLARVERFACRVSEGEIPLLTVEVAFQGSDGRERSFYVP